MRATTLPAVLFTLVLISASMAAEVYKWTDDQGRTHYSEQNPQNQTVTIIEPSDATDGMEGLTPDMQNRLKDLEKRRRKEQAAKEREARRVQLEQENKDRDAALVADCKRNLRSYCDSADRIRKVENHGTDKKRSSGGRRER